MRDMPLIRVFHSFLADEQGQDLIEHTLLVAFIALASAGLFLGVGEDAGKVRKSGSTTLNAAATSLSPVNASIPPSGNGAGGGGDRGRRGH